MIILGQVASAFKDSHPIPSLMLPLPQTVTEARKRDRRGCFLGTAPTKCDAQGQHGEDPGGHVDQISQAGQEQGQPWGGEWPWSQCEREVEKAAGTGSQPGVLVT